MKKLISTLLALSMLATALPTVVASAEDIKGDVNGDGYVDKLDSEIVLQYYADRVADLSPVFSEDSEENERIFNLADVDGDGAIELEDITLILANLSPRKGDFDADGTVDQDDVDALQAYYDAKGDVELDPSETSYYQQLVSGDLNGDGKLTLEDVALVPSYFTPKLGDVNGDSFIDRLDVEIVLQYYADRVAGLSPVFSEDSEENERIFNLADMDGDGVIELEDAKSILSNDVLSPRRGDFDGDGTVDQNDVNALQKYLEAKGGSVLLNPSDADYLRFAAVDVDGDEELTSEDVARISNYFTSKLGDVNGDSFIDDIDIQIVTQYAADYAAGLQPTFSEDNAENEQIFALADTNGDGEIDETDVAYLTANITPKLGDLDGDGSIGVDDAVALLQYYASTCAGLSVPLVGSSYGDEDTEELAFAKADVDGDGEISVSDAVSILQIYAQKSAGLSVTETIVKLDNSSLLS